MGEFLLIIGIMLVGIFTYLIIDDKIKQTQQKEYLKPENALGLTFGMTKNAYGNYSDGYIFLHKRTRSNRRVLKLETVKNSIFTYHPEETIYTGATVGGITTGGFHTIDAHHTYSSSSSNNCKLTYTEAYFNAIIEGNGNIPPYDINEIRLSAELLKEAQEHSVISKFLSDNKLVLLHMTTAQAEKIMLANDTGNVTTLMNSLTGQISAMYPSKEDATILLNWICGE